MRNTTYRLVVRGELDARFHYLFNGMELTHAAGTTVLSGQILDDAQLYGYIERLAELGLELLSVQNESNGIDRTHRTSEAWEGGTEPR